MKDKFGFTVKLRSCTKRLAELFFRTYQRTGLHFHRQGCLEAGFGSNKLDQGSLSLWELEKLLAVILQKEQVVGIDICGECSTTLNLFEEKRETVMDSQANKELLRFIRSSSGLQ